MPVYYPPFIFGMHDRGAEHLMLGKNKRGWVLVTEALGSDPNNHDGSDYTDLSNQGLGVIVRLNNGYGSGGTIPHSTKYGDFARRCGNFVAASPGGKIWIIGNEMNLANERPGGPSGQAITPQLYADCYTRCRNRIHSRPGHEEDQVVIGVVGPWNTETKYPGNQIGDWVRYLADVLALLGDAVDGIALHTYTHGQDPNLVFSNATMSSPFQNRHFHFYAYRDFMAAIPQRLSDRPVYITETDQYGAWRNENTGWVRNAFSEINAWNQDPDRQPIQALILFRWIIGNPNDPQQVGWAIENKPGVQADFRDAMGNDYRVVLPPIRPEYLVAWLEVDAPGWLGLGATTDLEVTVRNDGRKTWASTGAEAVRLGYRWIDAAGTVLEGTRTDLPQPVAAYDTVTFQNVRVQAPGKPGYYTLELDLVEGASGWFSGAGSPTWRAPGFRVGAQYLVSWLSVDAPAEGLVGETVTFPVRVRNEGAMTWPPGGNNPVNLTYKWLDADRNPVVADGLRTPLGREVAPLEEIALNAKLQFPSGGGEYILQMDMVQEFVTWFQWKGSPVYEVQVRVEPLVPEYAVEWLDYEGPDRMVIGQPGVAYVEVKNVGVLPWPNTGQEAVLLGYRWFDAQDQEVLVDGVQTLEMPHTIEPGQVAIFRDVDLLTPRLPGSYRLVWDLQQAGEWLSSQGVAVLEQTVQLVAPEYGVEWDILEPWPAWMLPGEEQQISFRLHNLGASPWVAGGDHPVHLAYTWFTQDGKLAEPWDTFRIQLPQDVPGGAAVDLLDVTFKVPTSLGNYVLRWDLVKEGEAWFFRQGGSPLEVPVVVSDQPLLVPWTAQASHNPNGVGLAFDGDPNTFWDSQAVQEGGMWFQVDLGRELVLDRVRAFSPGRGFPVGYKLMLSADGHDWHLVSQLSRNWTDIDMAFSPTPARYLRLEQTGQPDWQASWMISEISVSATRPWAGADASHYADDAHEATDGRLDTHWNTRAVKQKPEMWFELDMGDLRAIERVTMNHPKSQQPRGYSVQISEDGQNWQEVGRNDDNWGTVDVQFPSQMARHVRVSLTNSSPYHPWGISQLSVWRSSPVWGHGRAG